MFPSRLSIIAAVLIVACNGSGSQGPGHLGSETVGLEIPFSRSFRMSDCTFATTGNNPWFPLVPGQVLTLAGESDGEAEELIITITDQTRDVGGVLTRIIEERHTTAGELVEVSRNYFAHCTENNTVFYFGEEVDNYENGVVANHDGSWLHGSGGAVAGVIMPGLPMLGARYYQEIAPGQALDRAEIHQLDAQVRTPYGTFQNALVTEETTPLEPGVVEYKSYAPGVGLLVDGPLRLVGRGG